jgi:hypothetical protein
MVVVVVVVAGDDVGDILVNRRTKGDERLVFDANARQEIIARIERDYTYPNERRAIRRRRRYKQVPWRR